MLKTVVVIAVLAIVGYGLYLGLNNGFQFQNPSPETPPWLTNELGQKSQGQLPSVTPGGSGQSTPGVGDQPNRKPIPKNPPPLSLYSKSSPRNNSGRPPNFETPKRGNDTIPPGPGYESPNKGTARPQPGLEPRQPPSGGEPLANNNGAYDASMASARDQINQGKLSAGLLTLSLWYEFPHLKPEQHAKLNQLLDKIAGSVIYSRKHLLEPPYRVRSGEQLSDIARQYSVPAGLLAKINGIQNPNALTPGQELKVLRGPFNAVVNSERSELTLWLNARYAGRFPISLGPEFNNIVGDFVVQSKTPVHSGHNNQPWIQLGTGIPTDPSAANGRQIGIAGMADPRQATQGNVPGRIGVSARDAGDLYDILSQGSKVTIVR